MSSIEAVYIFDEHNNPILEHIYRSRPPSARTILPLYLAHPSPRPSLIYCPETNPASLVFSIIRDRLLFLSASSNEIEPLLVIEFLHRVADAFEEFLGSPLLATKIEASSDVVAQLLFEMCDGGTIAATEPNALRDVVESPSWMGKLLGGVGLPGSSPALSSSPGAFALQRPIVKPPVSNSGSAVPWRRSNVRHTSNEMYVDIVEKVNAVVAPSGRPLSAFVYGTIAFTSKVSGVPDLVLTLSCPGGKTAVEKVINAPMFHPCVRLARWRERPGQMSFIPPDGKFILASYEVDLLPPQTFEISNQSVNLQLPASVEMRTSLGPAGADFEVKLSLSSRFFQPAAAAAPSSAPGSSRTGGLGARLGAYSPALGSTGTSAHPTVEDIAVKIPVSAGVRNVSELRASKGDVQYSPGDVAIEWAITGKELAAAGSSGGATLRCTVVGPLVDDEAAEGGGLNMRSDTADYTDDAYQTLPEAKRNRMSVDEKDQRDGRLAQQNASLMPSSATLSFGVKGWLASGIKVESLVINTKTSRGLGAGVTPYKGVKYVTVSRDGVEIRC